MTTFNDKVLDAVGGRLVLEDLIGLRATLEITDGLPEVFRRLDQLNDCLVALHDAAVGGPVEPAFVRGRVGVGQDLIVRIQTLLDL